MPAALELRHPLNSWIVSPESGIVSNTQLKIFTGGSYASWLCDGSGNAFMKIGASSKAAEQLRWNSDKTALELSFPDKSVITFSAESGEVIAYKTSNGNSFSSAQLAVYLDIVRDESGVLAQVWNYWDGLMNIENASAGGYTIALYLPSQVGVKDAISGLYSVAGTPFKTFTIVLSDAGKLTVTELDARAGATPFPRSVWFENGTWNSSLGSGTEEIITRRTRSEIDSSHFSIVTETLRAGDSVLATCTEDVFEITNYGNRCQSRTEASGTSVAQTTYFTYDNIGRLTKETLPDGSVRETGYDTQGRVSVRYEPWAGGKRKITYYYYQDDVSNNADLKRVRVAAKTGDVAPDDPHKKVGNYFRDFKSAHKAAKEVKRAWRCQKGFDMSKMLDAFGLKRAEDIDDDD